MNSCILMAQIVQEPQLRYTADQMAIAEMLVEFSERGQDNLSRLKVVGWGNLAQEIQKSYHQGDRVIIEGRLTMNSVQLDGYKEKRAELTVQKIHPLGAGISVGASVSSNDEAASSYEKSPVAVGSSSSHNPTIASDPYEESEYTPSNFTRSESPAPQPDYGSNADNDDIPF